MYTTRTLLVLGGISFLLSAVSSTLTSLNVGKGSIVESNPIVNSFLIFAGNLTFIIRSVEILAVFSFLVILRRSIQKRGLTESWWFANLMIDFAAPFLTIANFLDMINDVSVVFYRVNLIPLGLNIVDSLVLTLNLTLIPLVIRLRRA